MFEVVNFNKVIDDRIALFAEWQNQFDQTTVQLGVRIKHAKSDADKVSSSMTMMGMPMPGHNMDMGNAMDNGMVNGMNNGMNNMPSMGELARDLQDSFNAADRSVTDTNYDIALSTKTQLTEPLSVYFGLGIKSRAPSYQARYLWTPMEATGGLADGHTYIGNINLESERAYQADLGFTWQDRDFMIAPHIFYQNIDDYIQGTPMGIADMSAKMMASMMANDDNPLKYTNVDAKLYGADVNWYYNLNSNFQLSGIVSYVKGERRDISDNLYRIAPLNGQISFSYHNENLISNLTLVAVASQDDISVTNTEKATTGYGLVNIDMEYFVNSELTLRGGIDNLLDREYQNHLGGYNRVKNVETPVMSRLPSEGLSAWVEATYSF